MNDAEGGSLREISQVGKRVYGTVVNIVCKASYNAQLVRNEEVKASGVLKLQSTKCSRL